MTEKSAEERAEADLRQTVADLQARLDKIGAAEIIMACRRVLALWSRMDGSSLDDPVIGFYGIYDQTHHVLGTSEYNGARDVDGVRFSPGSPEEAVEVEHLGRSLPISSSP